MARRRTRKTKRPWLRRAVLLLFALPVLYLTLALAGAVIPVNSDWEEPETGIPVYISSNGVHLDFVMPAEAAGLSWRKDFPGEHFGDPNWPNADWVMVGAGDRGIYLETPTWADLRIDVAATSMIAGDRVMHVQWVGDPGYYATAKLTLRPEEYRRLFAAIRADFDLDAERRPQRIDHPGYWDSDAFYEGIGNFNAVRTCNQWVNAKLRIAGVKASLWTPFSKGLTWRHPLPDDQST